MFAQRNKYITSQPPCYSKIRRLSFGKILVLHASYVYAKSFHAKRKVVLKMLYLKCTLNVEKSRLYYLPCIIVILEEKVLLL